MTSRVQQENGIWARKNFWEREFRDIAEEAVDALMGYPDSALGDPEAGDTREITRGEDVEVVRQILFKHLGLFMPFAGMVEELGELAHALLKKRQGIRTNEDHDANARDAYADIRIYGVDLCNRAGWDDETVVEEVWDGVVKKRDWTKDPEKGGQ